MAKLATVCTGLACVVIMLAEAACQHTLVFTERTAFKLGIDVNDDPTTPVNVTAGLKRSVLSVTPPRDPDVADESGQSRAEGEAVSMLSWFDLRYANAAPLTGKLTIRTQFASGAAATTLASKAEAIAKVVGVPLIGPAPADLQPRREAAADFVKGLTPDQADQLAMQLGVDTGPQAIVNILGAISAADTKDRFDMIAQRIRILFGREV